MPTTARASQVEDGLVARSRRGAIGESWWSGRFLAVLNALGVGGRLDRGKTYARAGQVVDLAIEPGAITATVQGSRDEPYRARIGLRPFADEALGGRARRAGRRLLVRRGPARRRGARRPRGRPRRAWASRCSRRGRASCRWTARARTGRCRASTSRPSPTCAAEEFDVDPFALLRWRGRDRATLLAALRDRRDAGAGTPTALEDLLDRFHGPGVPVPAPPERTARLTPDPEALLDELPPLDVDGVDAREVLRPLYRRLAGPPVG